MTEFKKLILQGIPDILPEKKSRNKNISHAPVRKDILTKQEKKLAIKNGLQEDKIQIIHPGCNYPIEILDDSKKFANISS